MRRLFKNIRKRYLAWRYGECRYTIDRTYIDELEAVDITKLSEPAAIKDIANVG